MISREQYRAHTDIQSIEEARSYILKTRIWFAVVAIGMILGYIFRFSDLRNLIPEISLMRALIQLLLWALFVAYCHKLSARLRGLSTISPWWSIVLAPVSWWWLYPSLMKPLKIIAGDIEPPVELSLKKTLKDIQEDRERFWKTFWIISGICIGIFVLGLVVLVASSAIGD